MTDVVSLLLAHPRDALAIGAVLAFFWALNIIRTQIKNDFEEVKAGQKELVKAVQDLRVEQVRLAQNHSSVEDVAEVRSGLHDIRQRITRLEGVRLGIQ